MITLTVIPNGETKCIHSPAFEFQYNHCNIEWFPKKDTCSNQPFSKYKHKK